MHKKDTGVTWGKVSWSDNSIAVKVTGTNIWLITGISVTFAPAMIDRRERNRSLLLLSPQPKTCLLADKGNKDGYE